MSADTNSDSRKECSSDGGTERMIERITRRRWLSNVSTGGFLALTATSGGGLGIGFGQRQETEQVVVISDNIHHIGDGNFEGAWNDDFQESVEGQSFSTSFSLTEKQASPQESTLVYAVRGVQASNELYINGQKVGETELSPRDGSQTTQRQSIPPGALEIGDNTLRVESITPPEYRDLDDFEISDIRLVLTSGSSTPDQPSSGMIRVTKGNAPDELAVYGISVSGSIQPNEDAEAVVEGSTALDFVGPQRGTDTFTYTGDITQVLLKGEATVSVDGSQVSPSEYDQGESNLSGSPTNTLTVSKDGVESGLAVYLVRASGGIRKTDESEAEINGSTALDFVGPERGTDTLSFSGNINLFLMKGDARVTVNGQEVDPNTL